MKYQFKSLQQILAIFAEDKPLWATEISTITGKSRTIVHKYIKELVKQKKLKKVGNPPHTKYKLIWKQFPWNLENLELENSYVPDFSTRKLIDDIFFKFSADGEKLEWFAWIKKWCAFRGFELEKKVKDYISIYNHILKLQDHCWLLSAWKSFWKHFEKVSLDIVSYADQYRWMEFGRWRLAEMTFYSKLSQNKDLINIAIADILPKLECLIQREKFDAIAITPWSIDRKNQLLLLLKRSMQDFGLPFVNIIKYSPSGIPIPQKSLKTRQQRIQNARNTIIVDDNNTSKYKKILLIDDFVWSWATLNETASRLKEQWVEYVYGFAFVWNLDLDYEVINEV